MSEKFKFVMPAEIRKSEDGEWKIAGLASTENSDQQGEIIMQKGIDLTPIDKKKGYFNFDHQQGPENLIGTIDGYKQTDKGLYVHGKLFKNHDKAKAVYQIMSSLGSGDSGRVGLSVEGKILERDELNKGIIKRCEISKVAVTMNPVNVDTYADLVKSMNASKVDFNSTTDSNSEGTPQASIDEATFTTSQVLEIVQKALGVSGSVQAPTEKTGGDALAVEDLDKECKKEEISKKKAKKLTKSQAQEGLRSILDNLQSLYPDNSRSEIWNAVKDRLDTKYPQLID